MNANRENLVPHFAEFMLRSDIYALILENIKNNTSKAIGRILNNLPPLDAPYEYLRPFEDLVIAQAKNSNNEDLYKPIETGITPSSIKIEIDILINIACITAMFDLFDNNGKLRSSVVEVLNKLKTHTIETHGKSNLKKQMGVKSEDEFSDLINKDMLAAYLLMTTQQIMIVNVKNTTFDDINENKSPLPFYIHYIETELKKRLDEIENSSDTISKLNNEYRLSLYRALDNEEQLSFILAAEIKSLLISSNNEEYSIHLEFKKARQQFSKHLKDITQIEQDAKTKVLAAVNSAINYSKNESLADYLNKLKTLTEVLKQTQAIKPNSTETQLKNYNNLMNDVSRYPWGESIANAMPLVLIAAASVACLAVFVTLTVMTCGVAIPFLAGLSFYGLLGLSLTSGALATTGIGTSVYSIWHRATHTTLVDTLKTVPRPDEKPMVSETTTLAKI